MSALLLVAVSTVAPVAGAVTNGSAAPNDKHVVHVSFANTKGTISLCSGVLATPTRVVFAAHCLNGEKNFPFLQASNDFGYLPGSPIKIRNEVEFPIGDFEGSPQSGDLASYTPTPAQPGFVPRAWESSSPMNFALPWMSEKDLAVIPLDKRVKLSSVTPAQLPFDPDGTMFPCSSSFSGRFLGYGSWYWDGAQSYRTRQAATTSVFRSSSAFSGHTYRAEFGLDDVITGLLPEALGFADAVQAIVGSTETRLIEPGDSGGPMFQGAKLCGINSAFSMSALSCNWTCDLSIPPLCGYFCELTIDDVWAPTDTVGAVAFLHPLLTDSAGHYHGTCGGDAPAALADIDTDGDQIPDGCDPCPMVPDAGYRATGVVAVMPDQDGDDVPDVCDNCPTSKNPRDPVTWKQVDSDLDGVGEACDKCPYSDLRGESDFVCCNTDADCHLGNPELNPKTNRCIPIGTAVVDGVTMPNACAGFAGRCSLGKDYDADGYADSCDNCRSQHNPDQADDDDDGAGNVCDNCAGIVKSWTAYPGEDHGADKNDAPGAKLECTSDAECVTKTNLTAAECSPAKLIPKPGGGVQLGGRYCNKFPDTDLDGIGNACDNCPSVANPSSHEGVINNQPNCNLDVEIALGEPYPYVGDACDPNPCTRTFETSALMTNTSDHVWLTLSLQPQVLPKSVLAQDVVSQAFFDHKYTGTPNATVGARFCDCVIEGKAIGTVDDCRLQCPLNETEYTKPTSVWTVPDMVDAPANPSYSLPASPPPGYFVPGAEFAGLPVEEPQLNLAAPNDQLAAHGAAPKLVSWDLGHDAVPGFGVNKGKLGVLWTAVRGVPQMTPGSSAVFRSHSNHYDSNYYGEQLSLDIGGEVRAACLWCQVDPCPHCAMSMDIHNLLIDPTNLVVVAQSRTQTKDITASFSSAAIGALLEPNVRWLQAAERGSWMRSGQVGLVALAPDATRVSSALVQVGGLVQPATRATDDALVSVAVEPASTGPAARSDFAAVLSGIENAVFVLGGKLLADGSQAADVWRYGIENRQWMRLPISGPMPRLVLAATYQPETRSLWLVDADSSPGVARILRLSLDDLHAEVVGLYPRAGQVARVELSNAPNGELLLSGTSAKLNRVASVVLRPGKHHLFTVGGRFHAGQLALEPTLTGRGLTLPLAQPGGKVQNSFVAAEELYYAPAGAGPGQTVSKPTKPVLEAPTKAKPTVADCL